MSPEEMSGWSEGWEQDAGLAPFERSENGASPATPEPATTAPGAPPVFAATARPRVRASKEALRILPSRCSMNTRTLLIVFFLVSPSA